VEGNGGNDVLFGNSGDDTLRGGDGNDTLIGDSQATDWPWNYYGDGNDLLDGGSGDDSLVGWAGINQFFGGDGYDTLQDVGKSMVLLNNTTYITDGVESLNHGVESFTIWGTDGNNTIDASAWTGAGITVYGGAGNDTIKGGAGNDTLHGGDGEDIVEGNGGHDLLFGNIGDDTLRGGDGNDTLIGDSQATDWPYHYYGSGNDILDGGDGDDSLVGWDGLNQFFGGDGFDTVQDAAKNTTLLTNSTYIANGVASLNHGLEAFTIWGTSGNDIIDASAWTGAGITVYGGAGNDTIKGGAGSDTLHGGIFCLATVAMTRSAVAMGTTRLLEIAKRRIGPTIITAVAMT
jgi:Ca2+-binding RTX toxin-like protein